MTAIHLAVEQCRSGRHQALVGRVESGWVVMGDPQVLAGYCLLIPDPVVGDLNELDLASRTVFLSDMARVGDVVKAVTGAVRINYAIYGNLEPALHAHVFPRFVDEPDGFRTSHPWSYDWSMADDFDGKVHAGLLSKIRAGLDAGI